MPKLHQMPKGTKFALKYLKNKLSEKNSQLKAMGRKVAELEKELVFWISAPTSKTVQEISCITEFSTMKVAYILEELRKEERIRDV